VAADTKKNFIPTVREQYAEIFPPYSTLYRQPNEQILIQRRTFNTRPPLFRFEAGDPVMRAIWYASMDTSERADGSRVRVPFICAANERRPGGDWETGCAGYEERLCRRSNLSATLSSPWPGTGETSNYPIPSTGSILSNSVVVCRGPHDRYEKLEAWYDVPVISTAPIRWPKLRDNGSKYSFSEERDMMREKMRGALRICLYNDYDRVVIGDFGLGNGSRNPPQEVAEMWRDVLLFDPDLRGQFAYVVFVFEEPAQSTMRFILEDLARKEHKRESTKGSSKGSSKGKSRSESHSSGSLLRKSSSVPTDMEIFAHIFDSREVGRVLSQPDPRYALNMITT
jgi:uncharacterized protein (TIGR02452 family)